MYKDLDGIWVDKLSVSLEGLGYELVNLKQCGHICFNTKEFKHCCNCMFDEGMKVLKCKFCWEKDDKH